MTDGTTPPPIANAPTAETNSSAEQHASGPVDPCIPNHFAGETVKSASKKTTKSRAGSLNYSASDITTLLDCVDDVDPLGANHWCMVAQRFAKWARENSRPERDVDSIKNKFDKLSNAKKRTEDPSCPPSIHRAKEIARNIYTKCSAISIGDDSTDNTEKEDCIEEACPPHSSSEKQPIGERQKKRKPAASSVRLHKRRKEDDPLIENIGKLTEYIGTMCHTVTAPASYVTREEVTAIVKQEITESLAPTNEILKSMHSMLHSLQSQPKQ